MCATVCCLFFWWQKKNFNHHTKTKNNLVIKQRSSRYTSKIPVIRSEDIISFVLPAVCKQTNPVIVYPLSNCPNEAQSLNKVMVTRGFLETKTTVDTFGSHRNNNLLHPANFNLKLYSRGLETNENVHKSQAKIGFSLQFDSSRQLLTLKILGALNLPARSKNIAPDPYVKIVVLPERQIKCVTKTLKSSCNPLFNQIFELDMSGLRLNETDILLVVRDRPEASRYESFVLRTVILGQAIFSMSEFEEMNHRRQVRWCLLKNAPAISPHAAIASAVSSSRGEMHISLVYRVWSNETKLINHGRIILELLQIRPISIIQNNQDKEKVTIKVLLYERGYMTSLRRTNIIRREEATAALCQKFVFALQPKMLHEASCQIVLVTKSAIAILQEQRERWDASPWVTATSSPPGQAVQSLPLELIIGMTWRTVLDFQCNVGIPLCNYKNNAIPPFAIQIHELELHSTDGTCRTLLQN